MLIIKSSSPKITKNWNSKTWTCTKKIYKFIFKHSIKFVSDFKTQNKFLRSRQTFVTHIKFSILLIALYLRCTFRNSSIFILLVPTQQRLHTYWPPPRLLSTISRLSSFILLFFFFVCFPFTKRSLLNMTTHPKQLGAAHMNTPMKHILTAHALYYYCIG